MHNRGRGGRGRRGGRGGGGEEEEGGRGGGGGRGGSGQVQGHKECNSSNHGNQTTTYKQALDQWVGWMCCHKTCTECIHAYRNALVTITCAHT